MRSLDQLNTTSIVVILFLVAITLSSLFGVRGTWINKDRSFEYYTAKLFYKSQEWRDGHVRAGSVVDLGASTALIILLAHILFEVPLTASATAMMLVLIGTTVLYFLITLFNWPSRFVPPDLRDQQGVLQERANPRDSEL